METATQNEEHQFVVDEVSTIIKETIENVIGGNAYATEKVYQWTSQVVENVLGNLSKLNKSFKYIVTCVIMQKNGAGLHTSSSCYWDNNTDGSCTVRWENKTIRKGTTINPYIPDNSIATNSSDDEPETSQPEIASSPPQQTNVTSAQKKGRSIRPKRYSESSLPLLQGRENTPLLISSSSSQLQQQQYGGIVPSSSWSNREGIHPYSRENRPNRRPFHLAPSRRISTENDAQLYSRFRYYSKLRAPCSNDNALVIPDHVVPTEFFIPFIPGTARGGDGKQNSSVTIIAIWNTMMGTSLLTMPWAFGQAGFVGGFFIMILMCGLCLYTAYRILTLQKTMGMEGEMHEVGYLCRHLWGGSLGKAVEGGAITFSVVTLLGAQVVYWVLMSNFLYNTGQAIHDAIYHHEWVKNATEVEVICPPDMITDSNNFNTTTHDSYFDHFWKQDLSVPLILVIPFVFLLSIRNPVIFTYFNSCGAVSVFAMYIFVIVKASKWGFNFNIIDPNDTFYIAPFKKTFMALSGTLSLAYFIHNCVITIMKGNRHPENNVRDLSLAYLLVALTYIPIGVLFYLTFPMSKHCVMDNFLDNFPPHDIVLAVVRGFLLFQMLTVFPLLTCFIRAQLLTYFLGPGVTHTWFQIFGLNTLILTICVLVSIFYPSIGFIIRWIGAIAGLAYIFVLPCLAYMQALYRKETLSWYQIIIHSIIVVLGIGNFIAQFFLS